MWSYCHQRNVQTCGSSAQISGLKMLSEQQRSHPERVKLLFLKANAIKILLEYFIKWLSAHIRRRRQCLLCKCHNAGGKTYQYKYLGFFFGNWRFIHMEFSWLLLLVLSSSTFSSLCLFLSIFLLFKNIFGQYKNYNSSMITTKGKIIDGALVS